MVNCPFFQTAGGVKRGQAHGQASFHSLEQIYVAFTVRAGSIPDRISAPTNTQAKTLTLHCSRACPFSFFASKTKLCSGLSRMKRETFTSGS
jgi:hypothetical protein